MKFLRGLPSFSQVRMPQAFDQLIRCWNVLRLFLLFSLTVSKKDYILRVTSFDKILVLFLFIITQGKCIHVRETSGVP